MAKYCIGLDFGTLSGRALLARVSDGTALAVNTMAYTHGVMDSTLPDGTTLPVDWALQHPRDYLEVLEATIPAAIREAGVSPKDIIGVGVDCTASTMMPVRADGTPLCLLPEYSANPHAWPKLWKHHAAQDKANRITKIAMERGEAWLSRYGGKVSSEWQIPKLWEVCEEAPQIAEAADSFVEVADWLVWTLTGVFTKSACIAGYKGFWHARDGYPEAEFYGALDPALERLVREKLPHPIAAPGSCVGGITDEAAARTGLLPETAVAAAMIDAHVTVPAVGITKPGVMLAIMGTSTCHVVLGKEERPVPGICGVVESGIYPGLYGYEAGQNCVGDQFAWFIENCLPAAYSEDAARQGKNLHAYLREKAIRLRVGESGLLALDWWNGNRSVLVDADLTGLVLGMSLSTKPEELYRALIESTAYGTRMILDTFLENGVVVEEFYASGGISQKDPMTMQIYADVIGLPVRIAGSLEGPALGSAIYAAVAAGSERGGYTDIFGAAQAMGQVKELVYKTDPENHRLYTALYDEYKRLHNYFGQGENDAMKRLKAIKKEAKRGK